MQPLITYLVASQKLLCPFLSSEQWYCIDSAIAAVLFLIASLRLTHKLSNTPKMMILLAAFLIPETVAIGMYPNTTVFAAALFTWSLVLIERNQILGIILLCIAPLFRVDVVIVYPVLPFLYLKMGDDWKTTLGKSLIAAGVVLVFLVLGFYMLDANPLKSLAKYGSWVDTGEYASKVLYSAFSFLTLANIILLPLGLYRMIKQRELSNILLAIVPILLLSYMFRSSATAAKHWAYLIPFVLLITVKGIEVLLNLFKRNAILKYTSYLFWGLFLIFSVRVDMSLAAKVWMNTDYSSANMGPVYLMKNHIGKHNLRFGIGAGQLIPTADEWMLCSGNLFYPLYIHNYKLNRCRILESERKYLSNKSNYTIYTFSWESAFAYTSLLQNEGYVMTMEDGIFVFQKGKDRIKEYCAPDCYDNEKNLRLAISKISPLNTFISTMHENEEMLMRKLADQGLVRRVAENLYCVISEQ